MKTAIDRALEKVRETEIDHPKHYNPHPSGVEATRMNRGAFVVWIDSRGAGRLRHFTDPDLAWRFLSTLRREANVYVDKPEEPIGGVEHASAFGEPVENGRKWNPWLDTTHSCWRSASPTTTGVAR